jgi:S-(hydroxymethyl)glutathione dehydrogenase / alcohol dehydrogenase
MKTNAAILYETNQPLVIEELETPHLNEGQVLVKVLYSGICHSQLNEIKGKKGKDFYLPHLLGHEGSGIVEEIGLNVTKVQKGDYVVLSWIKGKGINSLSSQYSRDNLIINSGAITTFNQYSVISENCLVKIPTEVPANVAALLGCAIPTGAGIIKNELEINEGDTLAIFGVGGIGSSALLYASLLNCSKIIAIDINETKLSFAKELGATHTINPLKDNPLLKIKEFTNEKGVDYAIECSGVKEVMETAFQSLKDQGKLVIAGNLKQGETISIDPFDLIKGKKIIGTWGGKTNPDEDIPYYANLYLQGKLQIQKLITKTFQLNKINEALAELEEGTVIRALINCQIK